MTSPYSILFAPAAYRQILALDAKHRKDMLKLLNALSINPRPPGANKIDGLTGLYAETMYHMRILYKIDEHDILILCVK